MAAGGGFQPKTLDATTSSYSLVSTTGGNGDRPQTVLGSGPRAAQREALAEAMRQEAAAKGGMPSYLTGGTAVAGLGPVLGAALCFLYSSRHGLLEDEMKQLLLQRENASNFDQPPPVEESGQSTSSLHGLVLPWRPRSLLPAARSRPVPGHLPS